MYETRQKAKKKRFDSDDENEESSQAGNVEDDEYEKDSWIASDDDVEDVGSSTSNSDDEDYEDDHEDEKQGGDIDMNTVSPTPQHPPTLAKKRGWPPNSTVSTVQQQRKLPGHPTFPLNHFSLTISKIKCDVELYLLDVLHAFLVENAVRGGVSTEVGHRAHNLHLQSVFSMKYPRDPKSVKELTKMIKALIKPPLKGYKVHLKPLSSNQTVTAMIGYITKDQGIL